MKEKIRIYVPCAIINEEPIKLDEETEHYLVNVMRLTLNSTIMIFNGIDGDWSAKFLGKAIIVPESMLKKQEDLPRITLFYGIIKSNRHAFLIEKATELMVGTLQPLLTDFTVKKQINVEKEKKTVIEACEQTGRNSIPQIQPVRNLYSLWKFWESTDPLLVAHSDDKDSSPLIVDVLPKVVHKNVGLVIGPEGGFSKEEILRFQLFKEVHFVSLGRSVLRSETASIAALTCYNQFLEKYLKNEV